MLNSCVSSRRVARPAVAAAAAVLGFGLSLSAGCVSSGRHRTLEEERDALIDRNRTLQGEVDAANQKGATLEQERIALAAEKEALEQRLAQLEERERALGSQLQQTAEEAGQLKATYNGLLGSLKPGRSRCSSCETA